MKLNDARLEENKLHDDFIRDSINKIGIKKTLIKMKDGWRKNSTSVIKDSYNLFKKDMRCYPFSGIKKDTEGLDLVKTINYNKNNLPIFEIEEDNVEYNIDFPVIPYSKFYISSNSCEIINDEFYTFGGYFVLHYDNHLLVIYRWSKQINDGWAFSSFIVRKNGLLNDFDESRSDAGNNEYKEMTMVVMKKFCNLMKKLIYKINKNQYGSYKIYSHGTYTEKKISRDVRGHKRHFWRDSGRFILPTLSKNELIKRGYHISELAIRNGELRRNVPFRLISQFKFGEDKKTKKNTTYDLIEKRIWRCEEKVYRILRELFPDKIIRRHDRKTLKGLELDFNLPEFRLGIEYDGEQHFDRKLCEEVFKSNFDAQVSRDRKKDKLCIKKKITLIRIKYDEPLTKTHIKKKLKQFIRGR